MLSAGAQAVAVTRPTTASMDTRQETLRMGGIIAHLAIRRQHSDHDDPRADGPSVILPGSGV